MSSEAAIWVRKSEFDFASATWEMTAEPPRHHDLVCFLCQQSVEKLLKAVLIQHGIEPPRTHDLVTLAGRLRHKFKNWESLETDLAELQPGAVLARYPGWSASEAHALHFLEVCERVRQRVGVSLGRTG